MAAPKPVEIIPVRQDEYDSEYAPEPLAAVGLLDEISVIAGQETASANLRSFGADPDGVEPADEAWANLVAEVPNGIRVILDGNFLFLDSIRNHGKQLAVSAYGATVTRGNVASTADEELAIFSGSYGAVNSVASVEVVPAGAGTPRLTHLTLGGAPVEIAVGDYVKVVSDDYVPASRLNTARQGWSGAVSSISGNVVTVLGAPHGGDTFAANVRVARLQPLTCSWAGGTLRRDASDVTPATGGAMIWLRDLIFPTINDVHIPLSSGSGFHVSGCFGADLGNLRIDLLRDSWSDTGASGPHFGYHVLDTNSVGTRLHGSDFTGGRHGFSTAQASPAAGGGAATTMRAFGVSQDFVVDNVRVQGTYVSAFDTHEASLNGTFSNCEAVGAGYAGFGLRGRGHTIADSRATDCNTGIRIFDDEKGGESYGHRIQDVVIEAPRLYGIEVDVHRMQGHPSIGVRQVGVEAFSADNVSVNGARNSAIKLTNARTGKVDARIAWAPTPATPAGALECANSEVLGGGIYADHTAVTSSPPAISYVPTGNDTSIIELHEPIRVKGASAQVDRIARHATATVKAILPDILLDSQPSNTAAPLVTADSIVDYRTLSGQIDSARAAVTASTSATDLAALGRSLRPHLTIQATVTTDRNLPNLPGGRVQGQLLTVLNRPASGGTGQSTANLTIVQGNGPRTYLLGAVNKILTPGQSCTLQWDVTIDRWCELS